MSGGGRRFGRRRQGLLLRGQRLRRPVWRRRHPLRPAGRSGRV